MIDPLDYYATHGPITGPGEHASLFDALPPDIGALCEIVQGLVLHPFWAPQYGAQVPKEREEETQLRHVSKMLARIHELDARPLSEPRQLEKRLIGNCRDFTVLLTSMLRHQGVPARARCGFAAYFLRGRYEDHWVCERWDAGKGRWGLVDAQLDGLQRKVTAIPFDPLDVPRDQFLVGGAAWRMCRSGQADPDRFGLSVINESGIWWVRQNLIRDVAALNKMELLPWDGWGRLMNMDLENTADDLALLDDVADSTRRDVSFDGIVGVYQTNEALRVPPTIRSYRPGGGVLVQIASG